MSVLAYLWLLPVGLAECISVGGLGPKDISIVGCNNARLYVQIDADFVRLSNSWPIKEWQVSDAFAPERHLPMPKVKGGFRVGMTHRFYLVQIEDEFVWSESVRRLPAAGPDARH
jgi:hypothetical protein